MTTRRTRRTRIKSKPPNVGKNKYELPTEKSIPAVELKDAIVMIYGMKKIGKTSLANQLSDNMLHLMVEPQARNLPIYQVACETYEDLIGYTKNLKLGKHGFDSVSLDPLPLFYQKSMDYTCRVNNFQHPSGQNDHGASWSKVRKDFNKGVEPLLRLDTGIIFHAHETEAELETREGKKYTIIRPEGGTQVWDFINANIENIWYYHVRNGKRFLQVRGDEYAFACTAWTDKFYTPDGRQVVAVPMGDSPEEGYENLLKAFRNEQERTYSEDEKVLEKKIRRSRLRRKK